MVEIGLLTRHDFVTSFAILVVVAVAMATTATAMVSHSAVAAACAVRKDLVAQDQSLSLCGHERFSDAILV